MTTSIIVGSDGQDGRILFDQLRDAGHRVLGVSRQAVRSSDGSAVPAVDILNPASVESLIRDSAADQIYYLAAYHHSSQDAAPPADELLRRSLDAHVVGLANVLEAMAAHRPAARLFYAASSHVFGNPVNSPQNESTPLNPNCVYGITKTAGIHCCRFYRSTRNVFAAAGILFNHESAFRGPQFVSQKIIRGALAIRAGRQERLVLGDLAAQIDWGYAPDYTTAMARILDLPAADDFVIATGQLHSVQDFVQEAFGQLGLDWTRYVAQDPFLLSKSRRTLVGDSGKLQAATGWRPATSFADMISRLLAAAGGH